MFPKIVNGSFAAIHNDSDIFNECSKNIGPIKFEDHENDGMNILQNLYEYLLFSSHDQAARILLLEYHRNDLFEIRDISIGMFQ